MQPSADDVRITPEIEAQCAAASLAHHRMVATGQLAEPDPSLQFPITVRRAQKTLVFTSHREYAEATLAHRGRILATGNAAFEGRIVDVVTCGQSIIVVHGISSRLDKDGKQVSALGFSHVHVRNDRGWKIIAIISDDR